MLSSKAVMRSDMISIFKSSSRVSEDFVQPWIHYFEKHLGLFINLQLLYYFTKSVRFSFFKITQEILICIKLCLRYMYYNLVRKCSKGKSHYKLLCKAMYSQQITQSAYGYVNLILLKI